MMRFDMTFQDTMRDGSSFIVLNFNFYWYCLSLKANFQKKIFVDIHVLEVFWVS